MALSILLKKVIQSSREDIIEFNNLKINETLVVGEDIIIPDGEMFFDAPVKPKTIAAANKPKKIFPSSGVGYFTRPILGGVKTQGLHGKNAVDIGAPIGTPILAAADGVVQIAKNSGYNGGYGRMIIIAHSNGSQTVYAHLSNVFVSNGQTVTKGESIGASGNSGRSTGPHLHFEVRGAENPF
jgi:murein DD-endopeptidase MepM/ murein hydrolase activator NlpD